MNGKGVNSTNFAVMTGYVGNDPFTHKTKNGEASNFQLALNSYWKDSDQQPKSRTEWVRVVGFGTFSNTIKNYVRKGRHLFISGEVFVGEDYPANAEVLDANGNWVPLTYQNGERVKVRQRGETQIRITEIKFLDNKMPEEKKQAMLPGAQVLNAAATLDQDNLFPF